MTTKRLINATFIFVATFFFLASNDCYSKPDNNRPPIGNSFKIHNFGFTQFNWYITKEDAMELMKRVQLEHQNTGVTELGGCRNELFFNQIGGITFITYGSLDYPSSLLNTNTYLLEFRMNSLVRIVQYQEIQDNQAITENIDINLGGRRAVVKSFYENIVRDYVLRYGQPVWSEFNKVAWSPDDKIIMVDYEFIEHEKDDPDNIKHVKPQRAVVVYTPKE